ncbi:MAG: histidine phosphatase family protein, partial [Candidatus Eiseniibacteriota bacterium]
TWGVASAQPGAAGPGTIVNPSIPRLNDVAGVGDPTLVSGLRKGGYVIFFRHAATDWTQHDTDYSDFENRAGQRNLSEAGKADAGSIGKAFQALAIPIDSVFASPMWRCRDTAQLAFGRCEKSMALFGKVPVATDGTAKPAEDRAQYRSERIHMLSAAPPKGTNRVLVGQQDPMLPIIHGLHRDELREGDALVIQPMGEGKFKVVAQVTVADWTRLAAAYGGDKAAK